VKISIVTPVLNRERTILDTIKSVQSQKNVFIEHVVVDGGSTDTTMAIVRAHLREGDIWISENDSGIYEGINKGILAATGEIIGLLHSDDYFYSENTVAEVVKNFMDQSIDAVFGDAAFIKIGGSKKIVRVYNSSRFSRESLIWGWIPAHSTIFFRGFVFLNHGLYKQNYKIASDVDFIARVFYLGKIKYVYLNKILVVMRLGGVSTKGILNTIILNIEVVKALKSNGIKTNLLKILSKYPKKLLEFYQFKYFGNKK
jgi:glycosyltransferase involved in cell wall biosynthesis